MTGLTAVAIRHLEARGLDAEIASRHGISSCAARASDPDGVWIEIPTIIGGKVIKRKYRTLTDPKRFDAQAGGDNQFWNLEVLLDRSLDEQPLIITEGELDALAAIQAGFARTISVPNGAPAEETPLDHDDEGRRYKFLSDAKSLLSDVREIVLATDSDAAGVALMNDLAIRLGKARCKWLRYPKGCKDLGDALRHFGARGVTETIARAQWVRVDGIYRMSELPPLPDRRAIDIGMPWKIRPGDFSVMTGVPSSGKSTVINEVAGRLATLHGWSTAFASFEQQPQLDHRRNLRTWFARRPVYEQSLAETRAADEWIDRHFSFIVPSDDDDVTLPWLLERAAAAVVQHGCRLIAIDPWNEMDHVRPESMTLTEYVGFAIKEFRRMAKKWQVHVMVAAHPAKMKREKDGKYPVPSLYDISDSAHWANKPDVGIVIHRPNAIETVLQIAKSRYHEVLGAPGDYVATYSPYDQRFTMQPKEDPRASDE